MNKYLQDALDQATLDEIIAFALEQWDANEIAEKLMELSCQVDKEHLRAWIAEEVAARLA